MKEIDWRENNIKKLAKCIYEKQWLDIGKWASHMGCSYEHLHEQLASNIDVRQGVELAIDRLIGKLAQQWLDACGDKDSNVNAAQTKSLISWLKKKEFLPDMTETLSDFDDITDLLRK